MVGLQFTKVDRVSKLESGERVRVKEGYRTTNIS